MQLRASIRPPRVFDSSTGSWQNASSEPDDDFEPSAESDSDRASQVDGDTATELQHGTADSHNYTNPPRPPRGRPRVRLLNADSAAASFRRASSRRHPTSSTSQLFTSAEPSFLNDDPAMAIDRANGRADLRRTAAHNRTTRRNHNRSSTPRNTPPRLTEAFPSLQMDEPRLGPQTVEGSHGIERLVWERSSGQTNKWRESFASVGTSDDSDDNGHLDMEDSDLEEQPKIAFASLWPSLRWEIITQIIQEGQQTYISSTHAVQAILNLELEDIDRFRVEALELGDDTIPPHITKWKLDHPNEPIDPEEAPPGELKRAYNFLNQEKLPFSLLGLLGVEDGDSTGEATVLRQGDEDDESTGHGMAADRGTDSSQPPTSQPREARRDSGFGDDDHNERNAPAALESMGEQPHPKNGNIKNKKSEAPGFTRAQPLPKDEKTKENRLGAEQFEAAQSRLALSNDTPTSALQEPSKLCQSIATTLASTPSLNQAPQHLNQTHDPAGLGQPSPRALDFPPNPPSASNNHTSPSAQLSYPQNQPFRAPPAVMVSPQSALFNRRRPDSTPPKALDLNNRKVSPRVCTAIMNHIYSLYPGIPEAKAQQYVDKIIASRKAFNVNPPYLPKIEYPSNPHAMDQHRRNMETTPAPLNGISASSLLSPYARDPQVIQKLLAQQRKAHDPHSSLDGQTQNPPPGHSPHPTQVISQQQRAPNDTQNFPNGHALGVSPQSDPQFGLLLQQQWRSSDTQNPRNTHFSASLEVVDQSLASLSQHHQRPSNAPNIPGSHPFDSPREVDSRLSTRALAQYQQRLSNAQTPSDDRLSGSLQQIDPRLVSLSQQQRGPSNAPNVRNNHPFSFPQAIDPKFAAVLAQHQQRLSEPHNLLSSHSVVSPQKLDPRFASMSHQQRRSSSNTQNLPTGSPFNFPPNMDPRTVALAVAQHEQRLNNARAAPEGEQVPVYEANPKSAQTLSQIQQKSVNMHASPNTQFIYLPVGNGEGFSHRLTSYQGVVGNARTFSDLELKNFSLGDDPALARAIAQHQQNLNNAAPLPNGQPRISPTSLKSGSAQMALAEQRFATATPTVQRVQITSNSQRAYATPTTQDTHRVQATPGSQSFQASLTPAAPSLHRPTPPLSMQSAPQGEPRPGQVWISNPMQTQRPATPHHQRNASSSSSSGHSGSGTSGTGSSPEGSNKRSKKEKKESPSAMKKRLEMEKKISDAWLLREMQKQQTSESNIDPALRDQNGIAGRMSSVGPAGKHVPSSSNPYQQYPHHAPQNSYYFVREAPVSPSPVRPQPSFPANMAMMGLEPRLPPYAVSVGEKRKRDENGGDL
ncbi:uncharacterized protein BDZ99DRAFT_565103 [Mytilinidion resinicola]|uniref:Uncharacterized protein n=1 Tax=Mytilinidion resinicola TaxID=574789 RepID=A0A6A6Z9G3_9PEZI|nr:uncharacterized protein BDZ99DRAFT_565103 [Mytilinidion resinicola]KAF2817339.1 hypothetical protein BDZ99DRAFT_565103 [Mytilinidion resinicola]